jgi:hypothetical protein
MQPCQGTKLPQGSIAEIFQFEVGMAAVVLLSFATGIDVVPKPHRTCGFPVISFFLCYILRLDDAWAGAPT